MKIKYILTTLYLIVSFSQGVIFAGTLKGYVTDKDRIIPLIGANVFIENTIIGAATDEEGRFVITGISSGNYQIIITMIGYERKIVNVNILEKDTVELNIQLYPTILQLSTIV